MKSRIYSLVCLALFGSVLLYWFSQHPRLIKIEGVAMTVPYTIYIGDSIDKERALLAIEKTFEHVNKVYNKFNPESEVSQLNRCPTHTPFMLSEELYLLLCRAQQLWTFTEGKFDPTVETYLVTDDTAESMEIPRFSFADCHLQNQTLTKNRPLAFDLGGIAKGTTVDLLVNNLEALGCHHILVEWGGEFAARGLHPSGRPWKIGIIDPLSPGQFLKEIELLNSALATSGDYLQTHQGKDGHTYTHIVSPKNGDHID